MTDLDPATPPEASVGSKGRAWSGRTRSHKTRKSVVFIDSFARWLITIGGIGTILSVLGVAVFLIWVVLPLFLPSEVGEVRAIQPETTSELRGAGIDEYQKLAWRLGANGEIAVFRTDTGAITQRLRPFEGAEITASSFQIRGDGAAFGFEDGSVRLAEVGFAPVILDLDDLTAAERERVATLDTADEGAVVAVRDGVVERTPAGQFRLQRLAVEVGSGLQLGSGPIRHLSYTERSGGPLIAAVVGGRAQAEIRILPAPGEEADAVDQDAVDQDAVDQDAVDSAGEVSAGEAPTEETEPRTELARDSTAEDTPGSTLVVVALEEDSNFLTGETTVEVEGPIELDLAGGIDEEPAALQLNGAGTELYASWPDGRLARWYIRRLDDAYLAEEGNLFEAGSSRRLGFFEPVLGGTTFLWGDSEGSLSGGFAVRFEGAETELPELFDARRDERTQLAFVRTKSLTDAGSPVTAMASSERSRIALAGFADGEIRMFNITNGAQVARVALPVAEPVIGLKMAPKEDGLLAITPTRTYLADLDPRYPEAGFSAFFRPVWYEGYAEPRHTWQSSSATDDFEMKLGLMPLVFGTLKATFYSMLFGAPLALLAALFTSEFLTGRTKAFIKPSIELMASLPSVVLGFLAALVFAPFIETVVPATLAAFAVVPITFLLGAYLWQLLPARFTIRRQALRFPLIAATVPLGLFLASLAGPMIERLFFAGDIKGWLSWDGSVGPGGEVSPFANPLGGWMILFIPLAALLIAFLNGRLVNPWMRGRSVHWDRKQYAMADLVKFFVLLAAMFAVAVGLSALCSSLGLDPRGTYVDTYVQRNALIVGFVMGFAIIPIIYTISEDALSTVPQHLRSASLGAGATPWQTATRIIVPTAMSGLFSALMIGLGRAVGETMIVLMAAGNTPVMEMNIFEGFRTLSANIAVELPEAVAGSTHYRTLFLAALALFTMTFVVNTIAEVIRQRFRKRAYQL